MRKEANNYAFIDSQNLNLSIRSLGWKLDWKRFRVYLTEKYGIKEAYIFIGYLIGNEDLYTRLQKFGYICIFKPTLVLPDGSIKGNVDAELVLHAMIEYPNYQRALIVSGDGDFYCLAEYLLTEGKLLKILIPNQRRYSRLFNMLSPAEMNVLDFMNPLQHRIGK